MEGRLGGIWGEGGGCSDRLAWITIRANQHHVFKYLRYSYYGWRDACSKQENEPGSSATERKSRTQIEGEDRKKKVSSCCSSRNSPARMHKGHVFPPFRWASVEKMWPGVFI